MTSSGEERLPKLIYKGAEAELYLESWCGSTAVRKTRLPKPYRVAQLDVAIRRARTVHETNLMHEARKLGVPVPAIQHIDPETSSFIMDYVNGPTLKEQLYTVSSVTRRKQCNLMGRMVALIHKGGIVHGDLTISNVLCADDRLFLIDFGLGDFSTQLEDRGVDLLLLNRAMKSTHIRFHEEIFTAFLNGYCRTVGKRSGTEAVSKMREVERRGRYFERA